MVFKRRREEREYREWQYEQARKEAERQRQEEEELKRRAEERKRQEERQRQEKERLAALSGNELLVELLYEIKGLREDIMRFEGTTETMMRDSTSGVQKIQEAIDDIQDNVDNIWLNTM